MIYSVMAVLFIYQFLFAICKQRIFDKLFLEFVAAWVFFRADSLYDALYLITHLHTGWVYAFTEHKLESMILLGRPKNEFIIALASLAFAWVIHFIENHGAMRAHAIRKTILSSLAGLLCDGGCDSSANYQFTFRVWESLTIKRSFSILKGQFYPNMELKKQEEGSLAYYTRCAIKKDVCYIGFSETVFIGDPAHKKTPY